MRFRKLSSAELRGLQIVWKESAALPFCHWAIFLGGREEVISQVNTLPIP
jgi:hypothetical protein